MPKPPLIELSQVSTAKAELCSQTINFMAHKKTLFFICGSAMRGQPQHDYLEGAKFVEEAQTLPIYRMHSANNRDHPAIYPVNKSGEIGFSIRGEIYELTEKQLRILLENEPQDLVLSRVKLKSGEDIAAMLCPRETVIVNDWPEISGFGSWLAFIEQES